MRETTIARFLAGESVDLESHGEDLADDFEVTRDMVVRLLELAERGELPMPALRSMATAIVDSDRLGTNDALVSAILHDWALPGADLADTRYWLTYKPDPAVRRRRIALQIAALLSAVLITGGLVWYGVTRERAAMLTMFAGFACLLAVAALTPKGEVKRFRASRH